MTSLTSCLKDKAQPAIFLCGTLLFILGIYVMESGYFSEHLQNFANITTHDSSTIDNIDDCPSLTSNLTLLLFVKPESRQLTNLKTMFLPSLQWFWPHPHSELVFITDQTKKIDSFITNLKSIAMNFLPNNFKWKISLNQKLMMNNFPTSLNYDGRQKQIPKFWSDNFTNSEFIGIVDADTFFVTPVMASDLFVDGKPVMRGLFGCPTYANAFGWAKNVGELLKLPYIGNFMIYFPVIVRRKDFEKIRNFMIEKNNLTHFDQVFDKAKNRYSEYTLIANYLWHFEHENYYWAMENSTMECDEMIPVTDQRVYQYAKRRLPPVSNHWPKVQNHLHMSMETVLLIGICYADRSLWPDCMKWGIPTKNATQSDFIFNNRINVFEWFFEHENWADNDPETALRGHRRRMEMLEQCQFHWNYTSVVELVKNYKDPSVSIHDFLNKTLN